LCGFVVALLLATSCGSDSDSGGPSDTAGPGATGGQPDFDRDATLRISYPIANKGAKAPYDGDPLTDLADYNDSLHYLTYGRLLRPTSDGQLVPDQAESVTVTDPSTIKIVLRPGQTFTDGTPFDATAVKAGLERTRDSGVGTVPAAWADLTNVQVTSPTELTLTVANNSAAGWYDRLGTHLASILKPGPVGAQIVGAGPMKVVSFTPAVSMTLERNDGYWDADSINIRRLEIVGADRGTELPPLLADQVDLGMVPPEQVASLSGKYVADVVPDPSSVRTIALCKRDGPLADVNVRRAINKAIDRDAISEAAYFDTATPSNQPWPEGHQFYDPEVADRLAYDPVEAKRLLDQSGYAGGFTFDAYVLPSSGLPEAAQIIQQQLKETLNVTMNINTTPDISQGFLASNTPGGGFLPSLTPDLGKLNQWTTDNLSNTCDYSDPELDKLATELNRIGSSSEEAVELWHQVDDIVTDDALSVFLVFGARLSAYDEDVVGNLTLWPKATFSVPDLRETYVKSSS
jgi:ABC-type transport system substrate-binding protein